MNIFIFYSILYFLANRGTRKKNNCEKDKKKFLNFLACSTHKERLYWRNKRENVNGVSITHLLHDSKDHFRFNVRLCETFIIITYVQKLFFEGVKFPGSIDFRNLHGNRWFKLKAIQFLHFSFTGFLCIQAVHLCISNICKLITFLFYIKLSWANLLSLIILIWKSLLLIWLGF